MRTGESICSCSKGHPLAELPGASQDGHDQRVLNNFHKETAMKLIDLNSSPRGEGISKTGMLLDALVEGMREAGAEVETIRLRQKKINNCTGCFTCWSKSPWVCIHKDDMPGELFRVNIGQTIVASMSTPSLFLIAKDLECIQVRASVNEADIGKGACPCSHGRKNSSSSASAGLTSTTFTL
jgi:hypothetical protein